MQMNFQEMGITASAYKKGDKWEAMTIEEFFALTVGELLNNQKRLIFSFTIATQPFFVVTHDEDEKASRLKHPEASVIRPWQLVNFFKKPLTEERLGLIPEVFKAIAVFPGAEVVE